jgi:hypothetical protein
MNLGVTSGFMSSSSRLCWPENAMHQVLALALCCAVRL